MYRLDYIAFTNLTGYGQAAKFTLESLLVSPDFDLKLTPITPATQGKDIGKEFSSLIRKPNDVNRVQVFHCIPDMQRRFSRNLKTIGVGVFETWEPPASWVAILNKNDAVMVPSAFNEKEFRKAGVEKPIFYIPHCIDMKRYHTGVIPKFNWGRFTFLFLGAWRVRKGIRLLLPAWLQTFTGNKNVQLVIKTDKPTIAAPEVRRLTSGKNVTVTVDPNRYSEMEMPSFIKSADCLIAPTLGEGFGLPALQAMALGVPVITTNHSGCQEYANAETAFLLVPENINEEKSMDGIPQFTSKKWIVMRPEQIGKVMRYVLNHPDEAKSKAQSARTFVQQRFSYENMQERFRRMLDNLL